MKKALLLLMVFAVFVGLSLAVEAGEAIEEQIEESPLEIIRDWKVLAVLALMLSVILVAIAFAVGIGFDMPEIKAWARTELTQIIANALIIAVVIGILGFADTIVIAMVIDSGLTINECWGTPPAVSCTEDFECASGVCQGGECVMPQFSTCLQAVTHAYLEDYVTTAKDKLKHLLVENVKAVNAMNTRTGIYCTSIFCAQAGFSTTWGGHLALDSDMYMILFEYYSNLLGFMEAQLFFIDEIAFKIGPMLLALGIVARSFFFTRKVGGLLIAIALGITFFFPFMYVFDWVTLDMAVAGDKGLDTPASECPPECEKKVPIAFYENNKGEEKPYCDDNFCYMYEASSILGNFSPDDGQTALDIFEGGLPLAFGTADYADGEMIISCSYWADPVEEDGRITYECPTYCRYLPYPIMSQCVNATVQRSCADVPWQCKVVKKVEGIEGTEEYDECPAICKVVPPLKSNCDVCDDDDDDKCCLDSAMDCRMTLISDPDWRPTTESEEKQEACEKAIYCPAAEVPDSGAPDAYDSCVYMMPDVGFCEDLCLGCPEYCRITGGDSGEMSEDCEDAENECETCHETCMVKLSTITALDPPADQCENCPPEKRLMGAGLPIEYTTGACSFENCSADYRAYAPRTACEMCLFTEEAYAYKPPINNQCDSQCKPPDDVPVKDADDYSQIGEDGLVGKQDIKDLSKLMLPAYVLPLFNIVATLIFIKGLSKILGGDIEIPGIAKVF